MWYWLQTDFDGRSLSFALHSFVQPVQQAMDNGSVLARCVQHIRVINAKLGVNNDLVFFCWHLCLSIVEQGKFFRIFFCRVMLRRFVDHIDAGLVESASVVVACGLR